MQGLVRSTLEDETLNTTFGVAFTQGSRVEGYAMAYIADVFCTHTCEFKLQEPTDATLRHEKRVKLHHRALATAESLHGDTPASWPPSCSSLKRLKLSGTLIILFDLFNMLLPEEKLYRAGDAWL